MLTSPLLPWTEFIPHKPTAKQLAFLLLPHEEAFYGGAVGGGKSDALLMAALQFVDVPHYSALLIRKTLTDLKQQEALLNRAHEWLDPWRPLVKYIPSEHAFIWSNKARLQFGYLGEVGSEEKFQSAAYQFIGFDEALQMYPEHYTYMFSRLRKTRCPYHSGRVIKGENTPLPADPECPHCQRYAPLDRVPLRMRSAGNPGGMSHAFFMERFAIERESDGRWVGHNTECPFIPATLDDNPYLDHKEYEKTLNRLDPATRARLRFGEWGATDEARFKLQWVVHYERRGDNLILIHRSGKQGMYQLHECQVFSVIDPAASVVSGVAGVRFHRQRRPSWTVIGTFCITPSNDLLVLDIERAQCEAPEIIPMAKRVCLKYRPSFVLCETNGPGKPIAQFLASTGIPIRPLWQYTDKIGNSVCAQVRMEQGKVYLPRGLHAPWRKALDNELFIWTGHPHETDDQIDVLSNACHMVTTLAGEDQLDADLTDDHEAALVCFPSFIRHY